MIGVTLGPYEILSKLGEGGMGEVYKARDTRLNRDVALKVLPEAFTADADRLARFRREAQVLAALNHPGIAAIFGFEEAGATHALAMEFLPGEDLSAIIARGPMALDDALPIARQIAEALEAAHEHGIVHRDLKPANIKVRSDGVVKVMDFGLAKATGADGSASAADAMNSPTLTARATQLGMILGTAAYMAPEQARGKTVDKRADIWSFGVVLFEMLTGRRAFAGDDVSTTLAAVLMKEPDWAALPEATPPAIRVLLRRCLERDPKLRLRDIGEARVLLQEGNVGRHPALAAAPPRSTGRAALVPWSIAGVAVLVAAAALTYASFGASAPARAVAFHITPPAGVRPMSNGFDGHGGAISPDGSHYVFSGVDASTGRFALYLRRLDAPAATVIPNTDGGLYPFWSPSSRSIAFFGQGKLKRIDIDGSALQDLCNATTGGWGGTWSKDDIILAGLEDPGPLLRVSAKGGVPQPATSLGPNEEDHDFPQFLPDGRHFIYTAWGNSAIGNGSIMVGSLDGGTPEMLMKDVLDPAAYSDPGQLLFVRNGTLMAQGFDPAARRLQGDPVTLATPARGPLYATNTGAVVYVTRPRLAERQTVWVTADGREAGPVMPASYHLDAAISPDGTRLAFSRRESMTSAADIWIRDTSSGGERRLTFHPGEDTSPVWSPDGAEIVFTSERDRSLGLYRIPASGAAIEKPLLTDKVVSALPVSQWHPTAGVLFYGGLPSWDVGVVSPSDGTSRALVATASTEGHASVSPDGRWLAYDARESTRPEVYLKTYPPTDAKWMVTTAGGAEPRWSKDGRALYFVSTITGALMGVDVAFPASATGASPSFGTPRRIHPGPIDWGWFSARSYDIDHTSGRFIVGLATTPGELTVILNWRALVR